MFVLPWRENVRLRRFRCHWKAYVEFRNQATQSFFFEIIFYQGNSSSSSSSLFIYNTILFRYSLVELCFWVVEQWDRPHVSLIEEQLQLRRRTQESTKGKPSKEDYLRVSSFLPHFHWSNFDSTSFYFCRALFSVMLTDSVYGPLMDYRGHLWIIVDSLFWCSLRLLIVIYN